ncbi:hypothetical protein GCM10009550_02200 [Actinocorallia libanotica]|uniref:Uncharacterized protein n=1 Tax=Actinocorallia libanotica TaxID=46162 RepID=A0ABN1Q3A4_9ACTN
MSPCFPKFWAVTVQELLREHLEADDGQDFSPLLVGGGIEGMRSLTVPRHRRGPTPPPTGGPEEAKPGGERAAATLPGSAPDHALLEPVGLAPPDPTDQPPGKRSPAVGAQPLQLSAELLLHVTADRGKRVSPPTKGPGSPPAARSGAGLMT